MDKSVNSDETPPRRRRRTAEVARREILDAAQKRLMAGGPDNVRLKRVGADVGLSHSSILHHFGSRDGLMEALRSDAFSALGRDLMARMATPAEGDPAIDLFEKISQTLDSGGYGRLLAWQLMGGPRSEDGSLGAGVLGPDGSGGLLDGLAGQLHAMRVAHAGKRDQTEPDAEETRMIAVMFACALLGEALAGHVMVRSAGLGEDDADRRRFRAWMAKLCDRLVYPPAEGQKKDGASPSMKEADAETERGAGD